MKTFAIRNEEDKKKKDLGYLIYYEKKRDFILNFQMMQIHGKHHCYFLHA